MLVCVYMYVLIYFTFHWSYTDVELVMYVTGKWSENRADQEKSTKESKVLIWLRFRLRKRINIYIYMCVCVCVCARYHTQSFI